MVNLDDLVAFVINAAGVFFFTVVVIKVQTVNRSWLQSILDEDGWIGAVFDDIDVFATQLVNDGLNPRPPWTNACTNRINIRVLGSHGNLGTITSLTCTALPFDGAVLFL